MKVTIKINSTEQLRPLLNFIQALTGKDFKQVKVKSVCSKKELTEKIEVKDEDYLKFPSLKECFELLKEEIINKTQTPKVKFEKGGITYSDDNNKNIHGEGLRCHPNCVKGTLHNSNGTQAKDCDRCKTIKSPESNKEVICQRGCYVDYGTKSALKHNDCKCDISKNFDKIVKTIREPNQNRMYYGSKSVEPNKQWIDEND